MYQLAPSVYAADYLHLEQQLAVMEQEGVRQLHVDIMDGLFVPNLSFGPDFVAALRKGTGLYLDVHLMVAEPLRFVASFAEAGADGMTVHWEACADAGEVLDAIHSFGRQAGLALKPETPLGGFAGHLTELGIWDKVDRLQLMTVAPGLKGQTFRPDSTGRIAEARKMIEASGREISIEVDGDITPENLGGVLAAGAEIIVAGKGLFTGDLREAIGAYRIVMEEAARGDEKACGM